MLNPCGESGIKVVEGADRVQGEESMYWRWGRGETAVREAQNERKPKKALFDYLSF